MAIYPMVMPTEIFSKGWLLFTGKHLLLINANSITSDQISVAKAES
jgi:hypothetical protein